MFMRLSDQEMKLEADMSEGVDRGESPADPETPLLTS